MMNCGKVWTIRDGLWKLDKYVYNWWLLLLLMYREEGWLLWNMLMHVFYFNLKILEI